MNKTKKHREFWDYVDHVYDIKFSFTAPQKDKQNERFEEIHLVEASALLEEKQKTKELLNTIVKFKEYFSAIESGEYNNNIRPSPLREYENVLQLQANELIKKYGDV